jgi:ribonucleoside-diphosphate reductase alpha chain
MANTAKDGESRRDERLLQAERFTSELGWKIFLDRYTLKDIERRFQVGDLAIVMVEPHPKWPKKDIGLVKAIQDDGQLVVELLTGPQKGDVLTRSPRDCDRPLETTLDEVAGRIARGVAAIEAEPVREDVTRSFQEEIGHLRFVPGGRIWAGAGTNQQLTYFNCYVLPNPRDSREGIVQTLGQMIEIMSRGGGVGINVSSLRPARAAVRGVNGRSSGAVSWMDLYSRATGLVEQGGSRRGALMLQIEDWHPDLWRFIDVKKTPGMVENANISVRVSDALMKAVKEDGDWQLRFPDTTDPEYDRLWDGDLEKWEGLGKPVIVYETTKARKVWHEIIKGAWEAAEPGVVFDDRHEAESNSWYFNRLVCTNPCAEQPLPAWGVCTLGHVNLAAMYDPEAHDVNWEQLRRTVRMGVRFLDDIVDATPYFFEENRANQLKERRIGMGTMGLGELLIRLGLRYGSPESVSFIDRLYQFIAVEAYLYDSELAREKGPFPAFDAEKYLQSGFMRRMPDAVRQQVAKYGTRNVTILTQAPTGTVGSMVGTSTGIEPFYALTYFRQSRLGFDEQYVPVAQEWREAHPGEPLPAYFVGAMDLTPEEHIYVQAAIQRWTDSSISKTANAPSTYTMEDTAKLYELAYDLGCKGVTIYRDKSRSEQVLHLKEEDKPQDQAPTPSAAAARAHQFPNNVEVYPVPSQVSGRTYRKETPAGTARVVINEVDNDPFEVFMLLGRAGSEVQSFMEALGRIISLYLRSSGDLTPRRRLQLVAEQLKGIGGANQMGFGSDRVLSVVDAIGQVLDRHLNPDKQANGGDYSVAAPSTSLSGSGPQLDLCPQCEAPSLVYEEGCAHCQNCGYSKC